MRPDMQLDYAIFQLTPTRTRCELFVAAQGLTYKLASGLLKPFISHLRAAEEQLAKGGYSIRLEPPDPGRASWFTKGTMERFVRFVSTPEVLERVSSVEVELIELEETSRQQTTDTNEANGPGQADNQSSKTGSSLFSTGGKSMAPASLEKPTKAPLDGVENAVEESSKQRLLRALDARRVMLQKEQGMAFARALAAGFSIENMGDLVLFAECFGATRLREACIKFMALCKKRQEAGLGLEDLDLAAAENAQSDIAYMGVAGDIAMSHLRTKEFSDAWSDVHGSEGKVPTGEDGTEKLTRRGSLDELTREYWQMGPSLRPVNGSGMIGDFNGDHMGSDYMDAETGRGPGLVKGHPMMASWQGQPQNQYMPNVHGQSPYGAMHPSLPNNFESPYGFAGPARQGQPGLPYPPYLGSPYMPSPYPDSNGWQVHPSMPPPQYWPGNQSVDGGFSLPQHHETISTPPPRDKDVHDDREETPYETPAETTRRVARRSASPSRRSASPMRKVQIGRSGGPKRSGMVVIRNINYIAPKAQNQDSKGDDHMESSDSWSEDGSSDEDETFETKAKTLRASVEDAVSLVESEKRATKDGKRRPSKKERRKASTKDAGLRRGVHSSALSGGDDDVEPDDEFRGDDVAAQRDATNDESKLGSKREKEANDQKNLMPEEGLLFVDRVRSGGSYGLSLETTELEYKVKNQSQTADAAKAGTDMEASYLVEDMVLLSQKEGPNRTTHLHSFDMFSEQEQQDSKKMPMVDDSFIVPDSRGTTIAWGNTTMESDFDFSSKLTDQTPVDKRLSDDSFIVLDRSAVREGAKLDWRMPFDMESEMPCDQNIDANVGNSAQESESFEPDDLFMVPERSRDAYNRAWNTPLDYDMQVLAADMMDNGQHSQEQDGVEGGDVLVENDVHEQEDENTGEKTKKTSSKEVSEREAKAKAMKEMLARRKATVGGRPGRPNPLAEAQLRAEKLRAYKAGLQKSKKEKEDEERKRIEDLKNQRRERIAARSNPSGGPQTPAAMRGARTPPLSISKSSPKVAHKLSSGFSLSPSVSRDKAANGNRLARPLSSAKSGENAISRSVPSLTDLHKESRRIAPVAAAVRASTGSQVLSHKLRSENGAEPVSDTKINGRTEDVGRTKSSRTEEKIGRTDSGRTEVKIGRTESGRIEEKVGRTESGRSEEKVGRTGAGRTEEKMQLLATKTVKKAIFLDGSPPVKSAKAHILDSKQVKTAPTSISPKPAAAQKKPALAPPVAVEEASTEKTVPQRPLPLQQKDETKGGTPETPTKATEPDDSSLALAGDGATHGNGYGYVGITAPASSAAETSITSVQEANYRGGVLASTEAVMVFEEPKEDASHVNSSLRADSIAGSDDGGQLELEVGSSVGEDYHAPVAHVSSSEDNSAAFTEGDLHGKDGQFLYGLPRSPLPEHYSPPSLEYTLSPSTNLPYLNDASQQELSPEANPVETLTSRSRKKWGDSGPHKAKGLKRLLLLGRKSSRSSAQNASDILSDGDEEDVSLSNGKNSGLKSTMDSDSFSEQAGSIQAQQPHAKPDGGSGSSSNKGSRSFFSLSTFRGKSTVKA